MVGTKKRERRNEARQDGWGGRVYGTEAVLVMMMPSPYLSYCGRPARPIICITSSGDNSVHAPFSGLYISVPFKMTVCAGRLTPHASVAVDTNTCTVTDTCRYQHKYCQCQTSTPKPVPSLTTVGTTTWTCTATDQAYLTWGVRQDGEHSTRAVTCAFHVAVPPE